MKSSIKTKIGIIGCGAIGSRIAKTIQKEFNDAAVVSGLYDIDDDKSLGLAKILGGPQLYKNSLKEIIKSSDFLVECVASRQTRDIIREVLTHKRSILVMSVGQLLNAPDLFKLADKNKCHLLIPSGALAGLDAIKAASLVNIKKITLTSRKPPLGFADSPYIAHKGIDLKKITKETVLYDGKVAEAVDYFPKNINVAASLALAANAQHKMRIRIIASPASKTNSHEVEVVGDFGRIVTLTDNVVCPDNPKTSYLAVLSAIQTLKQHLKGVKIGT